MPVEPKSGFFSEIWVVLCDMVALKAAEVLPRDAVPSPDEFAGIDNSEKVKVEECVYKNMGDTSWGFLKITGRSFSLSLSVSGSNKWTKGEFRG